MPFTSRQASRRLARNERAVAARVRPLAPRLTPEEESIPDPEETDDIDDTLPADLWFLSRSVARPRD